LTQSWFGKQVRGIGVESGFTISASESAIYEKPVGIGTRIALF
jgi:hypothetical protein